ncbi:MAG: XisH family protein [Pyrinomonadaceae bacterium]|nr:XisH family protein [Pyrinomonadaceae bacterium]
MPAKDKFHDVVKDGWTITDDPLFVKFGGVDMFVDLGAEKLFAAEKNGQKIAAEIKSFLGISLTAEFQDALGQVLFYRVALRETYPDKTLYLAVPIDAYDAFFKLDLPALTLKTYAVNLIVYDERKGEIVQWSSQEIIRT